MTREVVALVLLVGCGRVGFEPFGSRLDAADVGAMDATTVVDPCDLTITGDTIALYSFEAGLGTDETGSHPGTSRGSAALVAGRCGGNAIGFGANGYLLVSNSPAFELASGSVELFVKTPQPTGAAHQTLIARDADEVGQEGHLLVLVSTLGEVVARIQRAGASYHRCSAAIPADVWVHVGVSFGGTAGQGFRLWVDGVEATLASTMLDVDPITCTDPVPDGGIIGNTNALVVGANNGRAPDGATDPIVDQYLSDGAIDQVRLRSTWRDFRAP